MARDNDKNNGRRDRPSGAKGRSGAARGPEKKFAKRGFAGKSEGDRRPYTTLRDRPKYNRDAGSADHAGRNSRPSRDGAKSFEKRSYDKPRFDKPREHRGSEERPRFSRPREDRPQAHRPEGERPHRERPKFERPRRDGNSERGARRNDWQEHPRSEPRSFDRNADRPRRENEDDSKKIGRASCRE